MLDPIILVRVAVILIIPWFFISATIIRVHMVNSANKRLNRHEKPINIMNETLEDIFNPWRFYREYRRLCPEGNLHIYLVGVAVAGYLYALVAVPAIIYWSLSS
jgi:hypothetical protein